MYGSDTDDNSETQKESTSKLSLPSSPKTEVVQTAQQKVLPPSTSALNPAAKKSGTKKAAAQILPTAVPSSPPPSSIKFTEANKTPTIEKQREKPASRSLITSLRPTIANMGGEQQQEVASKRAQDADHLSIGCHLFPRLSESNLQFHDIYWNFDRQTQTYILRKRMVKVTKLLKLVSVKHEKHKPASTAQEFLAEIYLVDCRPQANHQIVSNVHCVDVPAQTGRVSNKSSARPVVLIRSNYAQSEVELRVLLKQQSSGADVGCVQLALLDGQARQVLPNRSQTHLFGDIRLTLDIDDVPATLAPQVDCLPDVLICDESWIPMLATFRQLTCERLADMENSPQTTWIMDPVMATFPHMLSKKNLVNIFTALLAKQKKGGSIAFRTIYMEYMLPLLDKHTTEAKDRLIEIVNGVEKGQLDALSIMTCKPCAPFDVYDYTVQLLGKHALD